MPEKSDHTGRVGPFAPGTIIARADIPHSSMVAVVLDDRTMFAGYRVLTAAEIERFRVLQEITHEEKWGLVTCPIPTTLSD